MASKPAIDNLAGQVMRSALIAYKVAKLIRRLNHEYESFDVARIAALKRLGTLSEDGTQYTLKNGEREQFEAEMAEVAANEVELNVPELSVEDVSERLNIGYINASDHVRKLATAGLVLKRNEGSAVRHKLTPRAESILVFCKRLQ